MDATRTGPRPVVEIVPANGWRAIDFRELFHHRELLLVLVWRDLKVRYRQTFLGVLWVVGQPLLTMAIFTVLFQKVVRIESDGVPYPLFVMAGLIPWALFSSAVSASSNSLIGSAHLISKVYFPRMIVPAAAVLGAIADLLVTFGVLVVMSFWYSIPPGLGLAFIPLIVVIEVMLALGCGLWLSALNVEYRDVRVLVPFLLQLWMYATPVVYPRSLVPALYLPLLDLNPVSGIVLAFRACVLNQPLPWAAVGVSALVGAVILISGSYFFRRVERRFADVL